MILVGGAASSTISSWTGWPVTTNRCTDLDTLTYAATWKPGGALDGDARHVFVHGIRDRALLDRLLAGIYSGRDTLLHFAAAEPRRPQHPQRRPSSPTWRAASLLGGARPGMGWTTAPGRPSASRLHRRRVYGSLAPETFTGAACTQPNGPYSASKAASDHLVRAWHHTYGLPVRRRTVPTTTALHFPEADPADDRQNAGEQGAADLRTG